MQSVLPVGERHGEGEIAAVVDDDVAFGGMIEMGACSHALVFMVEQVEVDRDLVIEPVHGADHALGVVGTLRDAVAARRQLPRQGDFGSVDGEDPVVFPEPSGGAVGEDLPVQVPERTFVELLTRLAGGRGRRRLVLWQLDARRRALFPEFAQGGPVALLARCDDKAKHEQHDQQAVEHAPALLPARVLSLRDGGGGGDERLPAAGKAAVAGGGTPSFGPCRRLRGRSGVPFATQDLTGAAVQRKHVHPLGGRSAGRADARPVRGAVARGPESGLVDERLAKNGPVAMQALPVVAEPARRHGKGRGGKVFRAHPGEHQEARVDHQQVPVAAARPVGPSDPAVPAGERLRRRLEQHASQPASLPVGDEIADVRPERASVAEIVVAVDEGVPQLPSLGVGDRLEAQRTQIGKLGAEFRLPVGGGGPDRPGRHVPDLGQPLRRQRQDAMPLQRLQQLHARPDPVVALRRHPVEMLADGLRQLVAAVVGKQRHGLLDIRNLPPGQAATGKGGRLQVGDSRIHGRFPQLFRNSIRIAKCLSRAPWKAAFVHRNARSVQQVTGNGTTASELIQLSECHCLAAGQLPDVAEWVQHFAPSPGTLPDVHVERGRLQGYGSLLQEPAS